jgi:DMSO/TMAO reductase YedYZ molybdopterin-dependent catalytic subunit
MAMGSRLAWAAVGMASAAVAIGAAEIVAGVLGGTSVVAAVGALVIALQPPGAKDLMVGLFGTNDKLALEVACFIGGVLLGAVLGLVARRDRRFGYAGIVVLGVGGAVLLLLDPLEDTFVALVTVGAAVMAGIAMLMWLSSMIDPSPTSVATGTGVAMPRRAFLAIAATFVAVGATLSVIGRFLGSQSPVPSTGPIAVPAAQQTIPPMPNGSDFGLAGLSPIVVPNDDFYLIDIRLSTPQIDAATWSLRIHGMVDREVVLKYADLVALPLAERYITIQCVSNEVGGRLVGNAKWTGASLNSVLAMAGVQPGATQVVGRSFDGWTGGFPTEHLSGAGKDAMIVVQMNGEPLPAKHGFPARLMVPGLYGYVSATKWVTEIELTTLEAFDAYWIPLGWSKLGPILTQSRIDVPRPGQPVASGQVQFAGVAWAPTRGIAKVELDLDESGSWQPTELSVPLSNYSWVQWRAMVNVQPGNHSLRVRATDGTGAVQEVGPTPPIPDGARGYHEVVFNAT